MWASISSGFECGEGGRGSIGFDLSVSTRISPLERIWSMYILRTYLYYATPRQGLPGHEMESDVSAADFSGPTLSGFWQNAVLNAAKDLRTEEWW